MSADLWDAMWTNVHLATIDQAIGIADGYGSIRDGALAVRGGRIGLPGSGRDAIFRPEGAPRPSTMAGARGSLPD